MKNLKEFQAARTEMTRQAFDDKFGGGYWDETDPDTYSEIKTVHVYGAAEGYGFHIGEYKDGQFYTEFERSDLKSRNRETVEAQLWDQWAKYELNADEPTEYSENTKGEATLIEIEIFAAIDKEWDATQEGTADLIKRGLIPSNFWDRSEVMTFQNSENPKLIYLVPFCSDLPNPVTSTYALFNNHLKGLPSNVMKVPQMAALTLLDVIKRAESDTRMSSDFTWDIFQLNNDPNHKGILILEEMGEVRGMFTDENAAAAWLYFDFVKSGHIIDKEYKHLTPAKA